MISPSFDYDQAFSRNLGWVTAREQAVLRDKRVAIAGMGGVGGSHLLTLTRLGIGAFSIADLDAFEIANFNRQAGAMTSTLGQPKVEVLSRMARDINPQLDIRRFDQGVSEANLDDFLADCDIYIDGLDFFAVAIRRAMFAACERLGIASVTAAPLGAGTATLCFIPGQMTFEEYFQLEGCSEEEQLLRFLVGLAPAGLHRGYLIDPSSINLAEHRGPSTSMGCEMAAGVAAAQALKILLHRGKVPAAPHGIQYDAFRNRAVHTWRPGGNRHPLQQLTLKLARKQMDKLHTTAPSSPAPGESPGRVEQVLELARWAPSGDNTQPWLFEPIDETEFVIHGRDTRDQVVYDLNGHASQVSLGALLATVRIAGTGQHCRTEYQFEEDSTETRPKIRVRLIPDPRVQPDPLINFITHRAVQRRPLKRRPLTRREKDELETAVGEDYSIVWREGADRRRVAGLLSLNGHLRLTLPEAYATHSRIIEWGKRYSEDRIPEQAVGVDYATARLMQWVLGSWDRVSFMNRYLAGTLAPRLQLDVLPALFCGAHFMLVAGRRPQSYQDYIAAGQALQHFWLTATRLGLQLQPEYTPLVFDEYIQQGTDFTRHPPSLKLAGEVSRKLRELFGAEPVERAVFMGRIGAGRPPRSRSLRKPLSELMLKA